MDAGYWMQDTGCRILDAGYWIRRPADVGGLGVMSYGFTYDFSENHYARIGALAVQEYHTYLR